jgi:hypothetical protein
MYRLDGLVSGMLISNFAFVSGIAYGVSSGCRSGKPMATSTITSMTFCGGSSVEKRYTSLAS